MDRSELAGLRDKRALSTNVLGDAAPGGAQRARAAASRSASRPVAQVHAIAIDHFQKALRIGDPGGVELPPSPGQDRWWSGSRLRSRSAESWSMRPANRSRARSSFRSPACRQSRQTSRSIPTRKGRVPTGSGWDRRAPQRRSSRSPPATRLRSSRSISAPASRDDLRIVLRRGRRRARPSDRSRRSPGGAGSRPSRGDQRARLRLLSAGPLDPLEPAAPHRDAR